MEEKELTEQQQDPREVVETYRQNDRCEVVECYARPWPPVVRVPAETAEPDKAPLAGQTEQEKRQRRRRRGKRVFAVLMVLALGSAAAAWLLPWDRWLGRSDSMEEGDNRFEYRYDHPEESGSAGTIRIPTYPFGQGVTMTLDRQVDKPLTASEVFRRVNPSVVTVMAQMDEEEMSVGTGVIFTTDGYVLTNYHVVEGGMDCSVTLDTGYTFPARYVAGDRDQDLAVLKVDQEGLPAASFADSDTLSVGDTVYAIGNPLGIDLRGTMTDGIVSAVEREVMMDEGRSMTLIQTNAALNFGNSGGPLINAGGQVVGINTIKMSSAHANVEGLGFAIPSSTVEHLVNDLLEHGKVLPEPALGIMVERIGKQLPDGRTGVTVISVTPGSPADRAGVQEGDIVVMAGGDEIVSSRDLLRARNRCQIGDTFIITVHRGASDLDLTLVLDQEAE